MFRLDSPFYRFNTPAGKMLFNILNTCSAHRSFFPQETWHLQDPVQYVEQVFYTFHIL
jgi:hypothetical protein